MNPAIRPLAATAALALLLTGCHVTNDKNGDKNNVQIGTPFGSMHIKTDDGTDTSAIGISLYPGAVPEKKAGKDDDNANSADINMSFGDFHLGVKAAGYTTPDPSDKIVAFYKKDLARYGEVITCSGDHAVGQPTRTSQGLSCDDEGKNHINTGDSGDDLELRTGSPAHQHIVGITRKDGYTKIGLVSLDLPTHLGSHDKSDSE